MIIFRSVEKKFHLIRSISPKGDMHSNCSRNDQRSATIGTYAPDRALCGSSYQNRTLLVSLNRMKGGFETFYQNFSVQSTENDIIPRFDRQEIR